MELGCLRARLSLFKMMTMRERHSVDFSPAATKASGRENKKKSPDLKTFSLSLENKKKQNPTQPNPTTAPHPRALPQLGLAPAPARQGQRPRLRRLPGRPRRHPAGPRALRPRRGPRRLRRRLRRRALARAHARVRRRRARDARAHDASRRLRLRVQHGGRRGLPRRDPARLLRPRRRRERRQVWLLRAPRRGGLRHRHVLPPLGRRAAQDRQGRRRPGRRGARARRPGLAARADRRGDARRRRAVDRAEGRAVLLRQVGRAGHVLAGPGGAVLYPAQADRVRARDQGRRRRLGVRLLAVGPHRRLQGPAAAVAGAAVLPGPRRRRLRVVHGAGALEVLDQHVPELGQGAGEEEEEEGRFSFVCFLSVAPSRYVLFLLLFFVLLLPNFELTFPLSLFSLSLSLSRFFPKRRSLP